METQGAVRTTHQRLPELDAHPAKLSDWHDGMNKIHINEPKWISMDKGLMASSAETKAQTCGDGNICEGTPKTREGIICGDGNICGGALNIELDKLPEDTIHHIHSLLPVQDAARVACVSREFLLSWRCYSKLILTKRTLGLTGDKSEGSEIRYINKIDKILNTCPSNGMKVKTLRIDLHDCESLGASYLDRWLRIAVKSSINELSLSLPDSVKKKYCFPYSVLFDETTSSLQSIYLSECIFEPIETVGCFGNLKSLDLFYVHITEKGLELLLSKSCVLERLQIYSSSEIICLKIPCTLQKLKFLIIKSSKKIRVVEISAPNLSTFDYNGAPLEIRIRDPSQLKDVYLSSFDPSRILSYVRGKLPSIARNVERLTLLSCGEVCL